MQKTRCMFFVVAAAMFIFSAFAGQAYADSSTQTNFEIAPPPLGYPNFESSEKVEKRVGVAYINISGSGITINGYGADVTFRKLMENKKIALDPQVGIFYLDGTIKSGGTGTGSGLDGSLSILNIPFGLMLEGLVLNKNDSMLVAFGGPGFSGGTGSFSAQSGSMSIDSTIGTFMYGLKGGAQFTQTVNKFKLTPYLKVSYMGGSSSTDSTVKYKIGATTYTSYYSSSSDIPFFLSTSIGFDVLYVPLNLTLSSVYQQAQSSGDNKGFKTMVFNFAYTF